MKYKRGEKMYGYISGYSDTDHINYCPACGEEVVIGFADGTMRCNNCGLRFGVIEVDDEEE